MRTSTCPLCAHPIELRDRACPNCSVDLALITVLTERALLSTGGESSPGLSMSPEVLVPRLGERLVEQGVLTEEQLEEALAYQEEKARTGQKVLVGQALIHLGMIDQPTLDRTITQQIFQLQDALRRANQELENRVQARTHDLQNALERLSDLSQLKANFVANISHELRTPLTHIKGYTEMISDSSLGDVTAEQARALEVMGRSIEKLESLINDLIRFSNSSQGEVSLNLQPVSARMLIDQSVTHAAKRIAEQQLQLSVHREDRSPHILCDPEKITWALHHLIDNAIKFTPSGGLITVTTQSDDRFVYFSIQDTGIGIPAQQLDEIFEPFHQLDAATTRKFSGTGLGLSLVRSILEAHQTEILVQSTPGQGSVFSFKLPVTNQKLVA